ncbi:CRISPR-associated protein Cas4 [Methanobrevibacter sp.]|uniref:CRISPR-associated protein Cas4 n=1 Tax=Methanobrevibacter sp. TaxID=66852 RepID=UPI00388D8574
MINVSSIKTNLYCPMKVYHQIHTDTNKNDNYQLAVEIKKLKIDVQDLINKNMRKVKKEMNLKEIECILSDNMDHYIKSNLDSIKEMGFQIEEEKNNEIFDSAHFNIKIMALKISKAMKILDKNAFAIMDMFFPNCMHSYLIKNENLELIGMCDKIEINDGRYYPVTIKSSKPPLNGVWRQDAIELVAHAILIEEEFETEVYVGFVEYEKIGDRRPVVMDVDLRKALFDEMHKVKEIVENKKTPDIKMNGKKCQNCEYKDICIKN